MRPPFRYTLAVATAVTLGGCATPSSQYDSGRASTTSSIAKSSSCQATSTGVTQGPSLALVSIEPASNSPLDRRSTITATLQYSIPNYMEGKYEFAAMFLSNRVNTTTNGSFPGSKYPKACGSTGTINYVFPMRYVWDDPLLSKEPLQMIFFLLEGSGSSMRVAVATTDWIPFSAR